MADLEFRINKFLTMKLEEGKSLIYVSGKRFRQCKFLILNIPVEEVSSINEIKSIDEAAEMLNPSLKHPPESEKIRKDEIPTYKILPEEEFWGLCSNLQVWHEHGYNTRLLHANLAFPLLKKLADVGDPQAKRIFKEELAERYNSGVESVREYLRRTYYISYLSLEEFLSMIEDQSEYDAVKQLTTELVRTDNLDIDIKKGKVIKIRLQVQKLKEVPEHIRKLLSLEHLILSYNLLEELPEWIGDFQNLKVLEATNNRLKRFPDSIGELKLLEILKARNNELVDLPETLGKLKSLKTLELYKNKLENIPDSIGNLSNLETLNLNQNRIEILPESIGNLKKLKDVLISDNHLRSLPEVIGNLKNLEGLFLGSNNLKNLPESIGNLKNLETIVITDNPIYELPKSLYNLLRLRKLYINNTNLEKHQIEQNNFANKLITIHYLKIKDNERKEEEF